MGGRWTTIMDSDDEDWIATFEDRDTAISVAKEHAMDGAFHCQVVALDEVPRQE